VIGVAYGHDDDDDVHDDDGDAYVHLQHP